MIHLNHVYTIYTGAPARTVGWRDPGFIHTAFLKELWPNTVYATFSSGRHCFSFDFV